MRDWYLVRLTSQNKFPARTGHKRLEIFGTAVIDCLGLIPDEWHQMVCLLAAHSWSGRKYGSASQLLSGEDTTQISLIQKNFTIDCLQKWTTLSSPIHCSLCVFLANVYCKICFAFLNDSVIYTKSTLHFISTQSLISCIIEHNIEFDLYFALLIVIRVPVMRKVVVINGQVGRLTVPSAQSPVRQ